MINIRVLILILLISLVPAIDARGSEISVIDFLVDARSYIGRSVTISNCQIMFAAFDTITCGAISAADKFGAQHIQGQIVIESRSLDRDGYRRALKICFDANFLQECSAKVTGKVYDPFGELGVPHSDILGLRNAEIDWN